jgi:hypothetical protein
VKNLIIAKDSTTTKARKSADLESLDFYKIFEVCLTKLEKIEIYLNGMEQHIFV